MLFGMAYAFIETIYFGSHLLPHSAEEVIADGLALIIAAFGANMYFSGTNKTVIKETTIRIIGSSLEYPDADSLPFIKKTPGVCGGDACVNNTRIQVWLLESLRRQGASITDLLESYPSLRVRDLELAYKYAREHVDEIQQAIKENEEA